MFPLCSRRLSFHCRHCFHRCRHHRFLCFRRYIITREPEQNKEDTILKMWCRCFFCGNKITATLWSWIYIKCDFVLLAKGNFYVVLLMNSTFFSVSVNLVASRFMLLRKENYYFVLLRNLHFQREMRSKRQWGGPNVTVK